MLGMFLWWEISRDLGGKELRAVQGVRMEERLFLSFASHLAKQEMVGNKIET